MTRVASPGRKPARIIYSIFFATTLLMLIGSGGCQTSARSQTALFAPAIEPSFTDVTVQAPVLTADDAFGAGDTARP